MTPRILLLAALTLTMCRAKPLAPPAEPLPRANYEWRIAGNHDAARALLQKLPPSTDVHLELARIDAKEMKWSAAREQTERAIALATTARERRKANVARAWSIIEGRDSTRMSDAIRALREVIAIEGALLEPSRLLARAGLLARDGNAALEGVAGYYHVTPFSRPPRLIAASYDTLARLLPQWNGALNDELAFALAGVKFFDEASLVTTNKDILDYAAALRRIQSGIEEYYRQLALGHGKKRDRNALATFDARTKALARRFGNYVITGQTGDREDMHMAHPVIDEELRIEQYGRTATVRFIVLDAVVTNGFAQWLADDKSGDGGWGTAKEIYQVRPLYANGALRDWMRVTDPETRAEYAKKRDLADRLRRQYLNDVFAQLQKNGLEGTALRDAFLTRIEREELQYSIISHEGRHAIDDASGERFAVWELEYRAKLSQLALADAPRAALASIVGPEVEGPHARANERLLRELHAWMRAHQVASFEEMTDVQIRDAARSLDPLAKDIHSRR